MRHALGRELFACRLHRPIWLAISASNSRASRLRVWLFFLQLATAVPAAVAVLIPDHYGDALYWLAVAGAVLLLVWWFVNGRYTRIRNAAQIARRGALLLARRGPNSARALHSERRRRAEM